MIQKQDILAIQNYPYNDIKSADYAEIYFLPKLKKEVNCLEEIILTLDSAKHEEVLKIFLEDKDYLKNLIEFVCKKLKRGSKDDIRANGL